MARFKPWVNESCLHHFTEGKASLSLVWEGYESPCIPALQRNTAQLTQAQQVNSCSLENRSSPWDCLPESCPKQGWWVRKAAPGQPSSALAPPSCCGWVMYRAGKEINANTWQSKWLSQKRKHWAGAAVGVQRGAGPCGMGTSQCAALCRHLPWHRQLPTFPDLLKLFAKVRLNI